MKKNQRVHNNGHRQAARPESSNLKPLSHRKRHPKLSAMKHELEVISRKNIREEQTVSNDPEPLELPTFPDSVYENLPALLQKVVERCDSSVERDSMLLGSIVTLGSCLTNVYGIYGGKKVYPCLYLFITAQASAGKGNLVYCLQLVNRIHEELRQQTQQAKQAYKTGMRQYNIQKWKPDGLEKPDKPLEKLLFIPANNSASGVFQLLSDNEGRGLIFETEADTLTHAFKSDTGHFSDGLRKGYQHEMISFHRRTDNEHVEIKCPCISMVLTGTNRQVSLLIPDAENGLLSRFIFYHMNTQAQWKDMLATNLDDLEEYFDSLGQKFYSFYKTLGKHPAIGFSFSPEQHEKFTAFFTQLQKKYQGLLGADFMATIRRLGIIGFRMAMILTALRIPESGKISRKLECPDIDFQRVLSMIRVLVQHSSQVFSQLPAIHQSAKPRDRKEQFLEKLPEKFNRADFLDLAKSLSIPLRTVERYMTIFLEKGLVSRDVQGIFTNLTLGEKKSDEEGY
ncbi:MAG TPA: DUF3987 domain-containing protein [Prolixibacteraceae bacterium]|jgi:hypothetical protein